HAKGSISPRLLRVGDGHCEIGFRRYRGDRAILIEAKIDVPQGAADLVCGATAAEDRSSEIIFEDIARPVSREDPTRKNVPAVADSPRHSSSVTAGKTRIEPFEPLLGDSGIGKRKGCIPSVPRAAGATRITQMRGEYLGHIGILDVEIASARYGAVAWPVQCNRREIK